MKKTIPSLAVILTLALHGLPAQAETVHQSLPGTAAKTSGGEDAVAKKQVDTREVPSGGKAARLAATTPQWGFVNYWFGIPSPAGPVIIRVKAFVDETDPAACAFYIKRDGAEPLVQKFEIPSDAAKNSLVTVDIPVDLPNEWNGLALKKTEAAAKPGPWIAGIEIVKP